ncbi:MAG: peptidase M20, partial [Thermomicrobiales bacterium]
MTTKAWESYLADHLEANQSDLIELLRIPSISTDPAHAGDVRKAAEWVSERLKKAGVPEVEIAEKGGHPLVIGRWNASPDKPTVLI